MSSHRCFVLPRPLHKKEHPCTNFSSAPLTQNKLKTKKKWGNFEILRWAYDDKRNQIKEPFYKPTGHVLSGGSMVGAREHLSSVLSTFNFLLLLNSMIVHWQLSVFNFPISFLQTIFKVFGMTQPGLEPKTPQL